MKRINALFRSTWWMWLIYIVATAALMALVDVRFWYCFFLYLGIFIYFAFVRFDENGERIER